MRPDDLYSSPNSLAGAYSRFRVADRLLLTGHSHQAWPDCGLAAQQQAWLDAAELVDDKWPLAFAKADEVRNGYRRLLNDPHGDIALDQNTLDLVVRFVSALPLQKRPRLVTTSGEFHTIRRLLDRLAEESIEIHRVNADPVETLAARLAEAVDSRTAAILCSSVLYQTGQIVPGLPDVAAACAKHGAELLIDAYHQLNVVPFTMAGLEQSYVIGGGYKYCQLGEGTCFMRLPADCTLRPITTGWYSEFDALAAPTAGRVAYGRGGMRFAGATFDPTSYYRAAAVFAFFHDHGLSPDFLRTVSQHQIGLLAERFDALDLDETQIRRDRMTPLTGVGGFLVLWSNHAAELSRRLRAEGVWTDHRGSALRLGPAPYLSDVQLIEAMARLGRVWKTLTLHA
jgi:selenocysteine lyase/cysteine desulfurase